MEKCEGDEAVKGLLGGNLWKGRTVMCKNPLVLRLFWEESKCPIPQSVHWCYTGYGRHMNMMIWACGNHGCLSRLSECHHDLICLRRPRLHHTLSWHPNARELTKYLVSDTDSSFIRVFRVRFLRIDSFRFILHSFIRVRHLLRLRPRNIRSCFLHLVLSIFLRYAQLLL
jgi:hypothetical protein